MGSRCDPGRAIGLAIGLVLATQGCVGGLPRIRRVPPPPPGAAPVNPEEVRERLVEAHDQARARAGLGPLAPDVRLEAAARRHARDMATRHRMTHRGSDGSTPFQRMEAASYRYRRAAENIASGEFTLETLMRGWMTSPPHRRNILGPYTQIGASCATARDGTTYWCVTFGDAFGP